jgi:hypothetical protein
MAVYVNDLLIHQFRGITVIKIFMQMHLFLLQFNPIFILKECARFACTSTLNILFEICLPLNVLLILKKLKHQEAISKFAAALLSGILPCIGFHSKRLLP